MTWKPIMLISCSPGSFLPDNVRIVMQLDGLAERERHRRQAQEAR